MPSPPRGLRGGEVASDLNLLRDYGTYYGSALQVEMIGLCDLTWGRQCARGPRAFPGPSIDRGGDCGCAPATRLGYFAWLVGSSPRGGNTIALQGSQLLCNLLCNCNYNKVDTLYDGTVGKLPR